MWPIVSIYIIKLKRYFMIFCITFYFNLHSIYFILLKIIINFNLITWQTGKVRRVAAAAIDLVALHIRRWPTKSFLDQRYTYSRRTGGALAPHEPSQPIGRQQWVQWGSRTPVPLPAPIPPPRNAARLVSFSRLLLDCVLRVLTDFL